MEPHPIQLLAIRVLRLSINAIATKESSREEKEYTLSLASAHSAYDPVEKKITVGVMAKTADEDDAPYELLVEIVGYFEVNDALFPVDKVEDWAEKNAPLILTPFLRDHVYSLTFRAGFRPAILPLITVPITAGFSVPKESET